MDYEETMKNMPMTLIHTTTVFLKREKSTIFLVLESAKLKFSTFTRI